MPRPIKRVLSRDRLRSIPETGFGWVDRRLVTGGLLGELSKDEALLYFFLCTVADREGISYYGDRRICSQIRGLGPAALDRARRNLEDRGLILHRHPLYQVLALPGALRPVPQRHDDPDERPGPQITSTDPRSIADILRDHHRSRPEDHQGA